MKNTYLIVGFGSIGRRHLECLRAIEPSAKIIIWRQYSKKNELPCGVDNVVFDLEAALATKPVGAIISNPATMHIKTARELAEKDIHLMIEKPLSDSMAGIGELISLCNKKNLVLITAYVLRFNALIKQLYEVIRSGVLGKLLSVKIEVGQFLPDWRPGTDYRQGVSARKKMGGGALLELSHELDYMVWIFGRVSSLFARIKNTESLDIDVEDLVEIIFEFQPDALGKDMLGSMHLDFLQKTPTRICKVVATGGILECDLIRNRLRIYEQKNERWQVLYENKTMDRNKMYLDQMLNFTKSIMGKSVPKVKGCDGRYIIELIEAVRHSAVTGSQVHLL